MKIIVLFLCFFDEFRTFFAAFLMPTTNNFAPKAAIKAIISPNRVSFLPKCRRR